MLCYVRLSIFAIFVENQGKIQTLMHSAQLRSAYEKANTQGKNLVEQAKILEEIIVTAFGIHAEIHPIYQTAEKANLMAQTKRQFVHRYALKKFKLHDLTHFDAHTFPFVDDLTFCHQIQTMDEKTEDYEHHASYAAWAVLTREGKKKHKESSLFQQPTPVDFAKLLPEHIDKSICRDGFHLTDKGIGTNHAFDQAHYCIVCHEREKDSCSKGMEEKETSTFKKNPLGATLTGCPLDQKISEMNLLLQDGFVLAALAVAMIDNPMICLTGHRICNDCMKGCIYQKQNPVNIPGIESQILKTVLSLPYGVEIYHALLRENPLHQSRPKTKPNTGYKVLVVGSGPAGINLAYHLLQEGHTVVMIDGAKIEPLSVPTSPIKDIKHLWEDLDQRTPKGFGGVTEYGITVRFDKNNLTLARMLLERYENFSLFGGIRFGGTLTTDQAFDELGFDHIALCCGAGKPKILNLDNSDAKGVRYASDFLMTLQQGGAFMEKSTAHLDFMMPCVVIGGGLTSIDTATEALAYYPRYVKKITTSSLQNLSQEDLEKYNILKSHHALFEKEREKAQDENRSPDFSKIFKEIGGVTLLYRKDIKDSPAYKLNHEELIHGLKEGIDLLDKTQPLSIDVDVYGSVQAITIETDGQQKEIPAKSILIATGTFGNTNIVEDEEFYKVENAYLKEVDDFTAYIHPSGKKVTFFGDMHPRYQGSVVKAMASAKHGYPMITESLQKITPANTPHFQSQIRTLFQPVVQEVRDLTNNTYELVIKAPLQARNFKPGQFFKIQNFNAPHLPACEPVAATGARVDRESGIITTVLLDIGYSTHLLKRLKQGDQVSLMGPTGMPTQIPSDKKILLIGGGVGNAVHLSIGKQALLQGCDVTLLAGFKKRDDLFMLNELEECSSKLVLACDEGTLSTRRTEDQSVHGHILNALDMFQDLESFDHILVIGSAGLMHAVQNYCMTKNLPSTMIASINAPMQCMMKGVCAQCLQKQKDESVIFTCATQDQCLKSVDFESLKKRLGQNSLSENGGRNRD